MACQRQEAPEGGHGHGHGGHGGNEEGGHGHGEAASISLTRFTERSELFLELPPLIAGERSAFVAHLTRLSDHSPTEAGVVTIELSRPGEEAEIFVVVKPTQPGIFRPVVIPRASGMVQLRLRWSFEGEEDVHELGEWMVGEEVGEEVGAGGDVEGEILLPKEQQWFLDFATARVERRVLRPGVALYGTVQQRPGGRVTLPASVSGQLVAVDGRWPRVGEGVEAGQVLARITPRLEESGADLASLNGAVRQARIELNHGRREVDHLQVLFEKGVIAERRLIEARGNLAHARVTLQAAQQRLSLRQRGRGAEGDSVEVEVRAPFAGVLRDVSSVDGTFAQEGAPLFVVVQSDALWLEVHVPERLISGLGGEIEGWFELPGDDRKHRLESARRIPGFSAIDPRSRTANLRFEGLEVSSPAGAHARIFLHVKGDATEAIAVPREAVIDDAGRDIVFVQRSGESFERRVVNLGRRVGDVVGVEAGLEEGERVVVRGAYIVKLAASGAQVPSHGHAH